MCHFFDYKKQYLSFSGIFLLLNFFILFNVSICYGWDGYVVKVLDGDSLRIKKGNTIIEVRLYGIDCPEYGQDFGNRAKRFSKKEVAHRTVAVQSMGKDSYGRTIGLVTYGGKSINRQLVKAGMAWVYTRYCHKKPFCSDLKKLENRAREQGIGLWQQKAPIPPWQWGRTKK